VSRYMLLAAAVVGPGGALAAQGTIGPDTTLAGGSLYRRVAAAGDSAEHYALLLPAGYQPDRRWPVLFVMDPRGRALPALQPFAAAASRLGYIVLSSYNTASDGPPEPNVAALNAMMADAARTLAADTTRFYLAGFSGTARMAWLFARQLTGTVRGVISVGAGPPLSASEDWLRRFAHDSTFSAFLAAGEADFNHDEVVRLDGVLQGLGVTHRTVIFPGPHGWAPAAVETDALEWLALHAGSREPGAYLGARLQEVDSLASQGDTLEAGRRLLALEREFGDSAVAGPVAGAPKRLDLERRARVFLEEERQQMRADSIWRRRAQATLAGLEDPDAWLTADQAADSLGLSTLLLERGAGLPRAKRFSALRRLEWLYLTVVFDGAPTFLARRAFRKAMVMLDLGHRIRALPAEGCRDAITALQSLGGPGVAERFPECA